MRCMTFPTVIETPLRLEPVSHDPFGDEPAAPQEPPAPAGTAASTGSAAVIGGGRSRGR
jgi:hypothetical protein